MESIIQMKLEMFFSKLNNIFILKLQSVSFPLCRHLCLKTCNCTTLKANYAAFEQVVFKNTNIFWSQAICNQMHI